MSFLKTLKKLLPFPNGGRKLRKKPVKNKASIEVVDDSKPSDASFQQHHCPKDLQGSSMNSPGITHSSNANLGNDDLIATHNENFEYRHEHVYLHQFCSKMHEANIKGISPNFNKEENRTISFCSTCENSPSEDPEAKTIFLNANSNNHTSQQGVVGKRQKFEHELFAGLRDQNSTTSFESESALRFPSTASPSEDLILFTGRNRFVGLFPKRCSTSSSDLSFSSTSEEHHFNGCPLPNQHKLYDFIDTGEDSDIPTFEHDISEFFDDEDEKDQTIPFVACLVKFAFQTAASFEEEQYNSSLSRFSDARSFSMTGDVDEDISPTSAQPEIISILEKSYTPPDTPKLSYVQPLLSKKEGKVSRLQNQVALLTDDTSRYRAEVRRLADLCEDLNLCVESNVEYVKQQQMELDMAYNRLAEAQATIAALRAENRSLEHQNLVQSGSLYTTQYRWDITRLLLEKFQAEA